MEFSKVFRAKLWALLISITVDHQGRSQSMRNRIPIHY